MDKPWIWSPGTSVVGPYSYCEFGWPMMPLAFWDGHNQAMRGEGEEWP